jgi:hypothetical protein
MLGGGRGQGYDQQMGSGAVGNGSDVYQPVSGAPIMMDSSQPGQLSEGQL